MNLAILPPKFVTNVLVFMALMYASLAKVDSFFLPSHTGNAHTHINPYPINM